MTVKQFTRLVKRDEPVRKDPGAVHDLIKKKFATRTFSVEEIEFNGHFGSNFFFSICLGGGDVDLSGLERELAFDNAAIWVCDYVKELVGAKKRTHKGD